MTKKIVAHQQYVRIDLDTICKNWTFTGLWDLTRCIEGQLNVIITKLFQIWKIVENRDGARWVLTFKKEKKREKAYLYRKYIFTAYLHVCIYWKNLEDYSSSSLTSVPGKIMEPTLMEDISTCTKDKEAGKTVHLPRVNYAWLIRLPSAI